jgi:hypothetical protein
MSIVLDTGTDQLQFSGTCPSNSGNWTWAGWVKRVTDGASNSGLFGMQNSGGSDWIYCGTRTADTNVNLSTENQTGSFITLTVATWYYVALFLDTGQARVSVVADGSSSWTSSTTVSRQPITTPALMKWTVPGSAETRYEGWKCWERTLTTGELDAEKVSYVAVSSTNHWATWKMKTATADADGYNDASANARHLTSTGGATNADKPTDLAPELNTTRGRWRNDDGGE